MKEFGDRGVKKKRSEREDEGGWGEGGGDLVTSFYELHGLRRATYRDCSARDVQRLCACVWTTCRVS